MPRTGGGTGPFVLNPVYLAVPGTTILATQHNTPLEDIEDTFNIPQPIAYGGTQGASAIEAMDNLFIVGADKASSASIDLDNVTGSFVNITGTTNVTSIALAEGAIRFARAVSALPLTASASLIVNGSTAQSYTCEAGDQMIIIGYAAAIVRIWVTGRDKVIASQFKIADGTDQTKQVQFSASGIPTATVRTLDAPYYSGTLGLVSDIRGQIFGLTLSNNVADPTNDIDIAAGAAVDSVGATSILLVSLITKRLDAAWAVGSGNGGLDTGSIANTTYHVYIIRRPDTGVVDALFSTNAATPTLPANYTQFRRVGSIVRASGAIKLFVQIGDNFFWTSPLTDFDTSTLSTTEATFTLLVPTGIILEALVTGFVVNAAVSTGVQISGTTFAGAGNNYKRVAITQVSGVGIGYDTNVIPDTNANIRAISSAASTRLFASTYGWIDKRGQS